eukprot:3132826-Rhodomonas_salina.2
MSIITATPLCIQVTLHNACDPDGTPQVNNVSAFRGFFWHHATAKVSLTTSDQSLVFFLHIPWGIRETYFLETNKQLDTDTILMHKHNPTVVHLQFFYTTESQSEFRFGCYFNALSLIENGSCDIQATNNNMQTGSTAFQNISLSRNVSVVMSKPFKHRKLQYVTSYTPPDCTTVKSSILVGNWFFQLLNLVKPHETPFTNIRTFVRNPNMSTLFTCLPKMWDETPSTFPVEVPIYLLAGALIMNGIPLENALNGTLASLACLNSPAHLLRIVRDTMLAFSVCTTEGKYLADTLFTIPSDDQCFADAHHFDDTFFPRDDCEGKLQQGGMVLKAICSLHLFTEDQIITEIHSNRLPILASISDPLLCNIVRVAKSISCLFHNKLLHFDMAVGEAAFASFQSNDSKHKKHVVGHSFGILFFNANMQLADTLPWFKHLPNSLQHSVHSHSNQCFHIVEATGWMDEFSDPNAPITSAALEQLLTAKKLPLSKFTVRSCTTPQLCDRLYCYVYMLGDKLVFSQDTSTAMWAYGAHPSHLKNETTLLISPGALVQHIQYAVQTSAVSNHPCPCTPALSATETQNATSLVQHILNKQRDSKHATSLFTLKSLHTINLATKFAETYAASVAQFLHPPPPLKTENNTRLLKWLPLSDIHFHRQAPQNNVIMAM